MTDPTITLDTTVCRADAVFASSLRDETVMMNVDRGHYYGLNVAGAGLWSALVEPMSVRDLGARLADQFGLSTEQAEHDVITFLSEMVARELVRIVSDVEA